MEEAGEYRRFVVQLPELFPEVHDSISSQFDAETGVSNAKSEWGSTKELHDEEQEVNTHNYAES